MERIIAAAKAAVEEIIAARLATINSPSREADNRLYRAEQRAIKSLRLLSLAQNALAQMKASSLEEVVNHFSLTGRYCPCEILFPHPPHKISRADFCIGRSGETEWGDLQIEGEGYLKDDGVIRDFYEGTWTLKRNL